MTQFARDLSSVTSNVVANTTNIDDDLIECMVSSLDHAYTTAPAKKTKLDELACYKSKLTKRTTNDTLPDSPKLCTNSALEESGEFDLISELLGTSNSMPVSFEKSVDDLLLPSMNEILDSFHSFDEYTNSLFLPTDNTDLGDKWGNPFCEGENPFDELFPSLLTT